MPRKTSHQQCVKCGQRAKVGAYTGYYVLSSKPKSGVRTQKAQPQVKATLPARGFCLDCFLGYARGQGWGRAEMKKLRTKLGKPNADQ